MSLEHDLTIAGKRARYDHLAKLLLSNRQILARLLKECVEEFRNDTIPEIIHAIDHDMTVSATAVNPGMTNQENFIPGEGTIYFDLLFSATAKRPEPIHVRVNVEPQNDYYPGYDSVSRGVFYCARLLSSQAETVFSLARQEYDRLEKVYSIWIFMHSSKQDADSITTYRMIQKRVHGNFRGKARYDLLEVTAICLCAEPEQSQNDLVRVLSTLFSNELTAEEKIRRLKSYGVQVSEKYGKEIREMCNLSQGVWDSGIRKGRSEGARETSIETARNLLKGTSMSDKQISDMVSNHVTPEEVGQLRDGKLVS